MEIMILILKHYQKGKSSQRNLFLSRVFSEFEKFLEEKNNFTTANFKAKLFWIFDLIQHFSLYFALQFETFIHSGKRFSENLNLK